MKATFSYDLFLQELQSSLPSSTGAERKSWALTIISENISITSLAPLLSSGDKTASHFLWLVSDVAIQDPKRFFTELPALFEFMEKHHPSYLPSFASLWHYCGVPDENDAKAIDYLFKWFLSAEIKPYIKTRALWVLVELCEKYPDIKRELKLCLSGQLDNYSNDFKKRAEKILLQLNE